MSVSPIPAAGFRTFEKEDRPYLWSAAIEAVRMRAAEGQNVPVQALGILGILCDKVDSSHGQFYGSWENLIPDFLWSRGLWFRWLDRLNELGLVKDLGYLPGRKTTTWQVLPDLYRLVSQEHDTSKSVDDTENVSQEQDTWSFDSMTGLVSQFQMPLVSEEEDTNISTSSNSESNTGAIEIDEENRQRQLAALKAMADDA